MSLSVLMALTLTPALTRTSAAARAAAPRRLARRRGVQPIQRGPRLGVAQLSRHSRPLTWRQRRRSRVLGIYAVIVRGARPVVLAPALLVLPERRPRLLHHRRAAAAGRLGRTHLRRAAPSRGLLPRERKRDDRIVSSPCKASASLARAKTRASCSSSLSPGRNAGRADQRVDAIVGRAFGALSQIRDGMVFPVQPPAVVELGFSGGFDMQLVNVAGMPREQFTDARNQLLGLAAQEPAPQPSAPQRPGRHAAAAARHRSARGGGAGRLHPRHQPPRSPAPGAAFTSTTSSIAAASSASSCKAMRRSAWSPKTSASGTCAPTSGEMAPFSAFTNVALDLRVAAA